MKCKRCNTEINLVVIGCPNDLCWGCLQETEKEAILNQNIEFAKGKKEEQK